jgi:hypothetical protein
MSSLHLREATVADVDAISRLLVQLYACELPGMLHGDLEAQVELGRGMLSSAPPGRRYLLVSDGRIVGMGSLATAQEPRPETPARVLLRAPLALGPVNGVRSAVGAARGLLTMADPPANDEGQIHSG